MSKIITVLMVLLALSVFTGTALADEPADVNKKVDPDEPSEPKPVTLSEFEICERRFEKEGLADEVWRCHGDDIIWYMVEAGVPPAMRADFLTVAACESAFDRNALGDGGWSKGLLQIRWDFWADWANVNGYAWELGFASTPDDALNYFKYSDWNNPIVNMQLGLTINYMYDMPRHGEYWHQWSGHPHMDGCSWKRDTLLANLYGTTLPASEEELDSIANNTN